MGQIMNNMAYERLLCDLIWYRTWPLLLMISFMSFCLDLDHVVGFGGAVGQHWRASFKSLSFIGWTQHQVNFQFALTWTFVFIFWNMNLTFENYFIHGVHSFILPMTCKNIALACNTTLDDGGREVYNLSSSNKHVNHYKHCLENKSKYERQTECIYLPLEEWWPA